jgi:hypothetical protein
MEKSDVGVLVKMISLGMQPWHARNAHSLSIMQLSGDFGHGYALSTPRFVSNQPSLLSLFPLCLIGTVFTVQSFKLFTQSVKPFVAALSNDLLISRYPRPQHGPPYASFPYPSPIRFSFHSYVPPVPVSEIIIARGAFFDAHTRPAEMERRAITIPRGLDDTAPYRCTQGHSADTT